jgi:hypothetical protein
MIMVFARVNLNLTVVEGHNDDDCQSELDCDHNRRP